MTDATTGDGAPDDRDDLDRDDSAAPPLWAPADESATPPEDATPTPVPTAPSTPTPAVPPTAAPPLVSPATIASMLDPSPQHPPQAGEPTIPTRPDLDLGRPGTEPDVAEGPRPFETSEASLGAHFAPSEPSPFAATSTPAPTRPAPWEPRSTAADLPIERTEPEAFTPVPTPVPSAPAGGTAGAGVRSNPIPGIPQRVADTEPAPPAAHRRSAVGPRRDSGGYGHRGRAAAALVSVAVGMGVLVAAMVTVVLMLASVALNRALG